MNILKEVIIAPLWGEIKNIDVVRWMDATVINPRHMCSEGYSSQFVCVCVCVCVCLSVCYRANCYIPRLQG